MCKHWRLFLLSVGTEHFQQLVWFWNDDDSLCHASNEGPRIPFRLCDGSSSLQDMSPFLQEVHVSSDSFAASS